MARSTAEGRRVSRLRAEGRPRRGEWLRVWVGPREEPQWTALLVGRMVGKATVRNKVRRRLREAVRALQPERPCVISANSNASEASYRDLLDELERLLNREEHAGDCGGAAVEGPTRGNG